MFSLDWPWMILLLPLPWLLYRYGRGRKVSARQPIWAPGLFAAGQQLGAAPGPERSPWWRRQWTLPALCWVLMVVALMRPLWQGDPVPVAHEARDLLLAIDISPSMEEADLVLAGQAVTRIQVVKAVVSDFLSRRGGDRAGLILFGAQPYIQAPLTFDLNTIDTLLQEARLGMAGNATAIGDAVGLAVKRLRERPEQGRVLILLTDGANTGGELAPIHAADLAAAEQIRIYTIGVGAEARTERGFFGSRRYNPSAELDESLLTLIAEKTGGQYFRARNTAELAGIYSVINELEPIDQDAGVFRPRSEWFWLPAGLSLCLLTFAHLYRGLRDRRRESTRHDA